MSRRDISLWDVANAGMNAYNVRQTSKLRSEMAEQNAILHSELEHMRMGQELERMKKEMIVQARNLFLDLEDELDRIKAAFPHYPAHSSLTFDILENMFEESGIESNMFEELHDIERFRGLRKYIIETSAIVSKLSLEDVEIKANLIRFTTEEEELQEAISLAVDVETTSVELEEKHTKWGSSESEWHSLETQFKERKTLFNMVVMCVSFFGLIGIGASYAVMILTTDMLDPVIEQYLLYLFWGLIGVLVLIGLYYKFNPVVGKKHPLRLLKESIAKLEQKMDYQNDRFEDVINIYDGMTTSEELRNLHEYWLYFVDEHSPQEGEEFTPVIESNVDLNPPKKQLPRGPPGKTPSIDMHGSYDDEGYEWLEFPESSDKWFYREASDQPWGNWEE